MISIVLMALALLVLPSCQPEPEPPERQPELFSVEELGFDTDRVPAKPKTPARVKKTARQYVREGYRFLLTGKEREARQALQAALRQAPNNQQAAMLLQQMDGMADLGTESFNYRIRPNDTLTGLAQRFLGDPLKFYLLAKYNDLPNPSRIAVGQIIKIPGRPNVPPEPHAEPEKMPSPPPPVVAEPTAPPAAAPPPVESPAPLAQPDAPQTAEAKPPAASSSRYYAVVIGIDAYAHLGQLDTAVTDAMAVTQVLEEQYGFNVIFLPDATRTDIVQILDNLNAVLTPQDNLLIYYAGHGIVDEDERGYWLPQDALPDVRSEWLATSEITEIVKAIAAKHVMVVADSCYSGTGVRNGTDGKPAAGDARKANLERIDGLRSRTVMTSGGLKPVADRGGGRHSVFAKAFLTALYTNGEVLEGQRLFAKMRPWIAVSSSQTPAYANIRHAQHEGGDFLFVPRSGN
ncbi:caspase family protein [Candidatus Entotheonella palauensis]|uniref:caspase family protein n=1 Tax=Candidatus Entotheonella palauensis TaxID=93172 RepID=UPI000B7FB3FC|nr:caspase family protein [Candidatus Entotheonella palauensis]